MHGELIIEGNTTTNFSLPLETLLAVDSPHRISYENLVLFRLRMTLCPCILRVSKNGLSNSKIPMTSVAASHGVVFA
jgi:hypothetical protein